MWRTGRRRRYPAAVRTTATEISAADFVARWRAAVGSELASYQLFVCDLSTLLSVPRPEPARGGGKVGEGRIKVKCMGGRAVLHG